MAKAPKQTALGTAYAITSPFGEWWTPLTFKSPEAAKEHLTEFPRICPVSETGFTFHEVTVRLKLVPKRTPSSGEER